jgi:tRNA-binding protein
MNDNELNWAEFKKVDMRVGTIIEIENFPEANKPAYRMLIDFGEEIGVKKSSAQLTDKYRKEDLLGEQIVAVVNFPKKQIANLQSECLVLGAVGDKSVTLVQPGEKIENGLRIG